VNFVVPEQASPADMEVVVRAPRRYHLWPRVRVYRREDDRDPTVGADVGYIAGVEIWRVEPDGRWWPLYPLALPVYLDHGRVHVGDPATTADQVYTAWAADRAEGRDAVMLAPTRELVAQLNARAGADRLLAGGVRTRPDVALADGNR